MRPNKEIFLLRAKPLECGIVYDEDGDKLAFVDKVLLLDQDEISEGQKTA